MLPERYTSYIPNTPQPSAPSSYPNIDENEPGNEGSPNLFLWNTNSALHVQNALTDLHQRTQTKVSKTLIDLGSGRYELAERQKTTDEITKLKKTIEKVQSASNFSVIVVGVASLSQCAIFIASTFSCDWTTAGITVITKGLPTLIFPPSTLIALAGVMAISFIAVLVLERWKQDLEESKQRLETASKQLSELDEALKKELADNHNFHMFVAQFNLTHLNSNDQRHPTLYQHFLSWQTELMDIQSAQQFWTVRS